MKAFRMPVMARKGWLCLLLCAPAAWAADPEHIEKPAVVAGTTWRLRVSDVMTKVATSETIYRVHSADAREIVIANDSNEVVLVLDAPTLAIRQGRGGTTFEPMYERVRYPLALGQRWEVKYAHDNAQCGRTQSQQSFKTVGWQDVEVPAGKYRALLIESEGRWRNGCGADRMTHRHWVAEGIGIPVRTEELIYAGGRLYTGNLIELMSITRP